MSICELSVAISVNTGRLPLTTEKRLGYCITGFMPYVHFGGHSWVRTCSPTLHAKRRISRFLKLLKWQRANSNKMKEQRWRLTEAHRAFSHDIRAAILVFKIDPVGVELFSYVNGFFCPNKLAWILATWVKTLDNNSIYYHLFKKYFCQNTFIMNFMPRQCQNVG